MQIKICNKCKKEKALTLFQKGWHNQMNKYYYSGWCKSCLYDYNKKYRKNNKERYNTYFRVYKKKHSEKIKAYQKEFYKNHAKKIKLYQKEYYKNNLERLKNKSKKYNEKYRKLNKDKRNRYLQNRKKNDIGFKMECILRNSVKRVIKKYSETGLIAKNKRTMQLAGCSIEEWIQYIESKFQKGMTWANYGKWHLDHIKPCSLFDLSKESEQKKCFHYTNLQPLWATDNLKKSDKYEY